MQEAFQLGAGVGVSALFPQLKLNWYKAADKGALCRAGVKLIHAEQLVSQVGALSRGKEAPQTL